MINLDSAVLYTRDIKTITKFYQDIIGLKLEYTDGDHYVSFIFPNGCRLGINKSEFNREQPGSQTFFITVDNIEAEYQRFKDLGYEFFEDYEEYDWGKYFAILDPDGNKVGFIDRNANS